MAGEKLITQQVYAVRVRSSSSSGLRNSLPLTNQRNGSSMRIARFVEAHNLSRITARVPEKTWYHRFSTGADGSQAGTDALGSVEEGVY